MIRIYILLLAPAAAFAVEPDRGSYFNEPCASIAAREQSKGVSEILIEPHHSPSVGGQVIALKARGKPPQYSALYECEGEKWSLSHTLSFSSLTEAANYVSSSASYLNAKYGAPLQRDNHLLSAWSKGLLMLRQQSKASKIYLWEAEPNAIELVLTRAPLEGWEVLVHMSQVSPEEKALLYPPRANKSFKADAAPPAQKSEASSARP